ncbi:helix-turn-helix transcriptional regulator [Spirulina sp. CS-785/01]|uniref:helix-turn-helix domain-containing protein n=1 Tax=Spirulina sp. CS-785/01 TaxID=3021716 RepID=UPI00232DF0E6|nr:helix-turn-helix transcriptional regulator [Spirulina sp. CS-785/01]MDB9315638.1 helix-turn-helix transcriptional regulator [Spirulina sp. CS-785/01]
MKARKISASAIAAKSGISRNHISMYRTGKRDMTSEKLASLIEAMEAISPGAKLEFCQRLAGQNFFAEMNSDQLSSMLFAIATTLQNRRVSDEIMKESITAS